MYVDDSITQKDVESDFKRYMRENREEVYILPKSFRKEIEALRRDFDVVTSTLRHSPLVDLFSSITDKDYQFEESLRVPHDYYNFRAFGVRITIWKAAGTKGEYNVATYGYMPKSKYFIYHRGYSGKYLYFNPTDDFEKAVGDWYLLVSEFLTTEIGISFNKFKNEFIFEPFDVAKGDSIVVTA